MDNDVAVLHLQQPVTFDVNIQPVDLASDVPAPGSVADLTGWGRTSPVSGLSWILQHTQVYIVSQEECRERYGASLITDQMICASVPGGGRGFCTVSIHLLQVEIVLWCQQNSHNIPRLFCSICYFVTLLEFDMMSVVF